MRALRQVFSVLGGVLGVFLVALGAALTNAIGDVMVEAEQFVGLLALVADVNELEAIADQGAAMLFLWGVLLIIVAWVLWPRPR